MVGSPQENIKQVWRGLNIMFEPFIYKFGTGKLKNGAAKKYTPANSTTYINDLNIKLITFLMRMTAITIKTIPTMLINSILIKPLIYQ
jgi:hypothetical protein